MHVSVGLGSVDGDAHCAISSHGADLKIVGNGLSGHGGELGNWGLGLTRLWCRENLTVGVLRECR